MRLSAMIVFLVIAACWPHAVGATPELYGNKNYFFQSNGKFINGLTVTVQFDSDFVSSQNGAGFMVNCYTPNNEGYSTVWQQLVFIMYPNDEFEADIQLFNWGSPFLVQRYVTAANVSKAQPSQTIPAGTSFFFRAVQDDYLITGAELTVINIHGQKISRSYELLNSTGRGGPISQSDLAPAVAITFTIGGYSFGATGVFEKGTGTISYGADTPLTPAYNPVGTNVTGTTTEMGNVAYGSLDGASSNYITQSFNVQ